MARSVSGQLSPSAGVGAERPSPFLRLACLCRFRWPDASSLADRDGGTDPSAMSMLARNAGAHPLRDVVRTSALWPVLLCVAACAPDAVPTGAPGAPLDELTAPQLAH